MNTIALGNVAKFLNGFAFKPSDWGKDGLPIIRIQNLTGTANQFNYTLRQVKSDLIIYPGDLLMSWSATLDVYRWSGPRGLLNQHIFKVFPYEGIDPDYLFFALKHVLSEISSKTHGSTMKHVTRGDFENTKILKLPLKEQRRLVDILSRAEGIVHLRREAQKKAQELIPALFLDMFGDPATNPKGWNMTNIGQLASYTRYGPRFYDRDYSQEGAHILRTTDIDFDGKLHWINAPTLAVNQEELAKYSLKAGTILITRTGATIGKTTVFRGATRPCIAGAYLIEIGVGETILPDYALHFFLSNFGQQKLTQGSRAVAQPNINVPTIKAIPIPLPPIQIQRSFVDHLKKIRSIESQQSIALEKAEATFQSLLHRAFSGQLLTNNQQTP